MEISVIRNEKDYNNALKRIDELIDCEVNSKEEDELQIISLLVWDYEERNYPMGSLKPIQAIRVRMEELGLKSKDLTSLIGDKSRVSDVLSMKRKLTLPMIRNLSKHLNIPIETLASEY